MMWAVEVLTRRELNRALLERQLLLRRSAMPVAEAVEHLVGLQAQAPAPPYYGLWSRLEGFDPHEVGRLLIDREAVRMTLMRGTVHLMSVADAAAIRPLVDTVIARGHSGVFGRRLVGVDVGALGAAARVEVADAPLTAREIGKRLIKHGIGEDLEAVANATRVYAPLVQVPPRGVGGRGGQAKYATFEAWTGRELDTEPAIEPLVLRYLRSFGPASVMDMQNWSGLTKLAPVFDGLRDRLVVLGDEDGRELFDLPDAPRPGAQVTAPVRLLGEFDNVLLGHADRSRIIPPDFAWRTLLGDGKTYGNLLVDGMLAALWRIDREGKRRATLLIRPHHAWTADVRDEVETEATRMLDFAVSDVQKRTVRIGDPVAA